MYQCSMIRPASVLAIVPILALTCVIQADEIRYELDVPRIQLSEFPLVSMQAIRDARHVLATEKGDTLVSNGRRANAIRIVGILGSASFASELVRDITFRSHEFMFKQSPYPCVETLMKFGVHAVPYILAATSQELTDRELQFFACTLLVCYQDREFALRRLEKELESLPESGDDFESRHDNLHKMAESIRNDPQLLETVFGADSDTWWPNHPSSPK